MPRVPLGLCKPVGIRAGLLIYGANMPAKVVALELPSWMDLLARDKHGMVKKTIHNIELILTCDDAWRGLLVKDSFADKILAIKDEDGRAPPDIETGPWSDIATTRLRTWFSKMYGINVDAAMADSIVDSVSERKARHPVREYLKALKWDGKQRLPKMLHLYFGAEDTEYHASVATMWMISGVARIFEPGCKADYMLVLIGAQGTRKSSAINVLAKHWSADSFIDIGRPDAMLGLQGVWIYEIAELAAIKGARDIERVKGFVTSRTDHFRSPYGRRYRDYPRQCVFAGTTNDETPLNDTENRRFWTVDCGNIDLDHLSKDVDQLWAEALVRYEMGEPWHPNTVEVAEACKREQENHRRQDPWQPIVERWLDNSRTHFQPTPGNWIRFDTGMTTSDALQGALSMVKERIDHYASTRMGNVLRDCGLVSRRSAQTGRQRRYFKDDVDYSNVVEPPTTENEDPNQEPLFP